MVKQNDNYWFKWVILTAAFMVTTCVFGFQFTIGSLLNEMLDKFGENRSTTATVQGILFGVAQCSGILSGVLVARFGVWKISLTGAILCPLGLSLSFFAGSIVYLCISIGVIAGLGLSMLFMSCTTAVGMAFTGPKRLLALSIQLCGVSVAGIVLPYFLNFIAGKYGLNGAFLILGGIYLNCIPLVKLFASVEKDMQVDSVESGNISKDANLPKPSNGFFEKLKQEMRILKRNIINAISIPYLLHLFAFSISISSLNAFVSLVVDILSWKGLSKSEALLAFPIAYGVGLGARLLSGIVKQCDGVNSLVLPIVYTVCGAAGQMAIFAGSGVSILLTGCALSGLAVSGVLTASIIVVVEIVGQENMAVGIGLVSTGAGLLAAGLGPIYGAIRDSTKSYDIVLMLTTGFQCVGTILFILTLIARKRVKGAS